MAPAVTKHVPERTCIACRVKRPKSELLRVVRTPTGALVLDPVGRQPGRGAYFCPAPKCWELGLRKGRLEHALRTKFSAEDHAKLAEIIRGLPSQEGEG